MINTNWWLGLLSTIIGVWVLVSEAFFRLSTVEFWNSIVIGGGIVLLAGYSMSRGASTLARIGMSGLAALLGVWLIVTPWTIGVTGSLRWSFAASGLIVAVLSGAKAYFVFEGRGGELRSDRSQVYQSNR